MATFDTAANILNDAAVELGLRTVDLSDPYASSEQSMVLLRRLLKALGQDLARRHDWSHLDKTHTFATVNGTATYALPADFVALADQSEWNRTQQSPLEGPLSAQGWQMVKALSTSGVVSKHFRIFGNLFQMYPTPTAAETVAFDYRSSYWVSDGESGDAPTTVEPSAAEHELWFDRRLLVAGLKVRFLKAKGMDASAAQSDYEDALSSALGMDGAAPVLDIGGGAAGLGRLLDGGNVPETGFGD